MQYHFYIDKTRKIITSMKNNPHDRRIEELQNLALRLGITWRHEKSSHCVFIDKAGKTFPVPAKKPLKAIYIKEFIKWLGVNDE
jgi:hypothetical protein